MKDSEEEDIGSANFNINKSVHNSPIHVNASGSDSAVINWLRDLDFKIRTMELKGNDNAMNCDLGDLRSENQIMRKQMINLQDQIAGLESDFKQKLADANDRLEILEGDNKTLRESLKKYDTMGKEFTDLRQKQEAIMQKFEEQLSRFEDSNKSVQKHLEKTQQKYESLRDDFEVLTQSHRHEKNVESKPSAIASKEVSIEGSSKISRQRVALSASKDNTIKIWDFEEGSLLQTLEGHSETVISCCVSNDNRLIISASHDCTVKVWDAKHGRLLWTLKGHKNAVNSCCISADSRTIISASDDCGIGIWNADTGKLRNMLENFGKKTYCCCISSDSEFIVCGSEDHKLRIWNLSGGGVPRCTNILTGHKGPIISCCISADDTILVSASSDGTMAVWAVKTRSVLQRFDHENTNSAIKYSFSCTISKDSKFIAVSSRHELLIYEGKRNHSSSMRYSFFRRIQGHKADVTGCCICDDNRLVLTSSRDKTMNLWDIESGDLLRTLEGHTDQITDCNVG